MDDDIDDLARDGIGRFESEFLVRDFFSLLATGDAGALLPFLHPDVHLTWGRHRAAVGAQAVLRLWAGLVDRMGAPQIDVVTIAAAGERVLVEHAMTLDGHDRNGARHLHCFSALELHDMQIRRWRQNTD